MVAEPGSPTIPGRIDASLVVGPERASSGARSAAGNGWRRAAAVLRAPQWRHFLLLPVASVAPSFAHGVTQATLLRLAGACAAAAGCLAFAYGVNAVADRDIDRCRSKNPVVGASIDTTVRVAIGGSAVIAIGSAALVGTTTLVAAALSLVASVLYSVGPRLKAVPFVCTLSNDAIFVPLLFLGRDSTRTLSGFFTLVAAFTVLLTQNQLLHELADREEDAAGGVLTTGGVVGSRGTAAGALAVGLLAAAAFVALDGHGARQVVAATGVTLGGALAAATARFAPARVRRAHRWFSLALGASLFVLLCASTSPQP